MERKFTKSEEEMRREATDLTARDLIDIQSAIKTSGIPGQLGDVLPVATMLYKGRIAETEMRHEIHTGTWIDPIMLGHLAASVSPDTPHEFQSHMIRRVAPGGTLLPPSPTDTCRICLRDRTDAIHVGPSRVLRICPDDEPPAVG